MTLVDTNYILRWFLGDVAEQAQIATKLLHDSAPQSLVIDPVNLAEVTYILRVQGYTRLQVVQVFEALFDWQSVKAASPVTQLTLEIFSTSSLDFEDCLLVARHQIEGHKVATFDKALAKRVGATSP